MWSFRTDLFYVAWCFQVHPRCKMHQYFIPFYHHLIFHCTDIVYYFNPSVDGHWFPPCILVVNNAFVNTCMWVSIWACIFISCGHIPRSRIAGSNGNSVFNILWNCPTFQSGCSGGHPKWTQVLLRPPPCRTFILIIVILVDDEWHLTVVSLWLLNLKKW